MDASSDTRAQSSTLGAVLLVGMMFLVVGSAVAVATTAFQDAESRASVQRASQSMTTLDAQIADLSARQGGSTSISLPEEGDGNVAVRPDEGSVAVTVSGPSTSVHRTVDSLGTVVYEKDGDRVAYQGGAVWRAKGGAVRPVSRPDFDYRYRNGEPSLTFSVPQVETAPGASFDGRADVSRTAGEALIPKGIQPLAPGTEITISVTSDYYRGWARIFRQETNGRVTVDDAANTATLELHAPPYYATDLVQGALTSPHGSISGTNGISVDSYTLSGGSVTPGTRGSVTAGGDYSMTNTVTVDGSLTVGGDLSTTNKVYVRRVTMVGGNAAFDGGTNVTFDDDVHVEGSVTQFTEATEIDGSLYAGGSVDTVRGTVNESLHAGGPVVVGGPGRVHGDLVADGPVTVWEELGADRIVADGDVHLYLYGPTLSADEIRADGTVYVHGGTLDADVVSTGGVVTDSGGTHSGSVTTVAGVDPEPTAPQHATIPTSTTVEGAIDAAEQSTSDVDYAGPLEDTGATDCTPCSLGGDAYSMDRLVVQEHERLVFDTGGNDQTIYVDDEVTIRGKVAVRGEGTVRLYIGGSSGQVLTVEGDDAEVIVDEDGDGSNDYDAEQLQIFTRPSAEVAMQSGNPIFTGVVLGPGDGPSNPGTTVRLTNQAEIYGGIVGNVEQVTNTVQLHYQETLADLGDEPILGDGDELTYVQVQHNTVEFA